MGDRAQDLGSVLDTMQGRIEEARRRAQDRSQEMQDLRNNQKRQVTQLSERNTALTGQLDEHTKKASDINRQLEDLVDALQTVPSKLVL